MFLGTQQPALYCRPGNKELAAGSLGTFIDTIGPTDANGYASKNGLPYGTYRLVEASVPSPYRLSDHVIKIEMLPNSYKVWEDDVLQAQGTPVSVGYTVEATLKNIKPVEVTFSIFKTGEEVTSARINSGAVTSLITSNIPLEGAKFKLYKAADDNPTSTVKGPEIRWTTDSSKIGQTIGNVRYFALNDTCVSNGYQTVDGGGNVTLVSKETALQNGYIVTMSDGYATVPLEYGWYVLEEVEPPEGYRLNDPSIWKLYFWKDSTGEPIAAAGLTLEDAPTGISFNLNHAGKTESDEQSSFVGTLSEEQVAAIQNYYKLFESVEIVDTEYPIPEFMMVNDGSDSSASTDNETLPEEDLNADYTLGQTVSPASLEDAQQADKQAQSVIAGLFSNNEISDDAENTQTDIEDADGVSGVTFISDTKGFDPNNNEGPAPAPDEPGDPVVMTKDEWEENYANGVFDSLVQAAAVETGPLSIYSGGYWKWARMNDSYDNITQDYVFDNNYYQLVLNNNTTYEWFGGSKWLTGDYPNQTIRTGSGYVYVWDNNQHGHAADDNSWANSLVFGTARVVSLKGCQANGADDAGIWVYNAGTFKGKQIDLKLNFTWDEALSGNWSWYNGQDPDWGNDSYHYSRFYIGVFNLWGRLYIGAPMAVRVKMSFYTPISGSETPININAAIYNATNLDYCSSLIWKNPTSIKLYNAGDTSHVNDTYAGVYAYDTATRSNKLRGKAVSYNGDTWYVLAGSLDWYSEHVWYISSTSNYLSGQYDYSYRQYDGSWRYEFYNSTYNNGDLTAYAVYDNTQSVEFIYNNGYDAASNRSILAWYWCSGETGSGKLSPGYSVYAYRTGFSCGYCSPFYNGASSYSSLSTHRYGLGGLPKNAFAAPAITTTVGPSPSHHEDGYRYGAETNTTSYYNEYYYFHTLDIPCESPANYYTSLKVTDVLPAQVSYAGGFAAYDSDGVNITNKFTINESDGTVTVTANAGSGSVYTTSGYYGRSITIMYKVLAHPDYYATNTSWTNNATVEITDNGVRSAAQRTRTSENATTYYVDSPVITRTSTAVNKHADIALGIRKVDKDTDQLLAGCTFEIRNSSDIQLYNANGTPTVRIPAGTLFARATSTATATERIANRYCNVVFGTDNLIYGESYYIVESALSQARLDEGYTLMKGEDGSNILFTFTAGDDYAPSDYEIDEFDSFKVVSDADNDTTQISWKIKNEKGKGVQIAKFNKSDCDEFIAKNPNYSLVGTQFEVYEGATQGEAITNARNGTNKVSMDFIENPTKAVVSTGNSVLSVAADGTTAYARLKPDVWYAFKEVRAGTGYSVPSGDAAITTYKVNSTDDWQTVNISNTPDGDPASIKIKKTNWSENNLKSLEGVVFSIEFFSGNFNTEVDARNAATAGTVNHYTWYVQTKKVGNNYYAYLNDSYLVDNSTYDSDPLFRIGGIVEIPFGTVIIKEVSSNAGHNNEAVYSVNGSNVEGTFIYHTTQSGAQTVSGNPISNTDITTYNAMKPDLSTTLVGYDRTGTGTETKTPVAKLDGNTTIVDHVHVYNLDDFVTKGWSYYVEGQLYLVDLTTDTAAHGTLQGGANATPIATVTSNVIAATQKEQDVDLTFSFDASEYYGRTVVCYVQLYRAAANGATQELFQTHNDVDDANERITFRETGEYSFYKHGEQFVGVTLRTDGLYDFNYEDKPLSNVHFEVVAANEIKNVHGEVVYTAGQVVPAYRDVTPNEDGILLLENLQYGNYILREKTSDGKHAIMADVPFTVNAETGDITNPQSVDTDLPNERRKITINVEKTDARSTEKLEGVRFGLYSREEVKNYLGTNVLSANKLVAIGTTDADGKITFTTDLPVGSSWYLQELSVPVGYMLSTEQHVIEFRDEQTVEVSTTVDKQIGNEPRPGELYVDKTDGKGNKLKDVIYKLEYSLDDGDSWSAVYSIDSSTGLKPGGCDSSGLENGMLKTDSQGHAEFTGLLADGKILYRLTEVKTKDGTELLADYVYLDTLPRTEDPDFDKTPYDVNGDGYIDEYDTQYLLAYIAGAVSELAPGSGDLNGDGLKDSADASLLTRFEAEWNDATQPVFNNGRNRVGFDVTNTVTMELPMTGSTGFSWLPFAGAVGLLGMSAGIFFILKKKRDDEEELEML